MDAKLDRFTTIVGSRALDLSSLVSNAGMPPKSRDISPFFYVWQVFEPRRTQAQMVGVVQPWYEGRMPLVPGL